MLVRVSLNGTANDNTFGVERLRLTCHYVAIQLAVISRYYRETRSRLTALVRARAPFFSPESVRINFISLNNISRAKRTATGARWTLLKVCEVARRLF